MSEDEMELKEKNGEHPFGDAGQLILLGLFLAIWIGDSFFLHLWTFPAHHVPLYIRLSALALCIVAGAYLSSSGHKVVSRHQRPSGLMVTGAFRFVRHPLYLSVMLVYLGMSASTASMLSFALLVIIFFFYDFIAGHEEKLLERRFGEEYRTYKRSTGKWLPRWSRKS